MLSVLVFRGVVLLCFVNSILSSEVAVRSGRTCARNGHTTVELQCSVNERIHVMEEWYGFGEANQCRLPTNESCREVLQTSIHGLAVNCNGKESCNETASPVTCNFAAASHAEVHYKCINDSMDICGFDTVIVAANESVYLHSPGYPYSVGLNNSCVVRVTGKGIQLTIAEQSLNGGTLTISGNGNKKWSNVNATLYNRKLTEHYSEVTIFYTDGGNDRSNVWISVIGSSPVSVTFNGGMLTSTVTSTLLVPMSEGSMPQHDVSSQRMSVTQSVVPANTLFTNTQTISTVSTSVLFTTMVTYTGTDLVSVTATATVDMTAQTTVTTVRIAPTTTSDAETMTVGMTLNETTHTPRTPAESDEDVVVIVASICACCGVVVIVAVVVAVVLCRCKKDKAIRSATSHNGGIDRPLGLISPHDRAPYGLRKHNGSQHYFIIDPAFVPGHADMSLNADSRDHERTRTLRAQDGYSVVLPRSSRLNLTENNTFTIKHPRNIPSPVNPNGSNADNDNEDSESPGTRDLKADQIELMDSSQFDRGNSTKSTCSMTENDVYSGEPPTTENYDVSTDDGIRYEESTPVDDLYHVEEDGRNGTIAGMVDNDIYETSGYDSTVGEQSGECEDVSVSATEDISSAGSSKEEADMMSNDLYHSFV